MAGGIDPISGAIGVGTDLFKTILGITQLIGGNKKLNNLEDNRHIYEQDKNILYNQKLSQQNASQGFGNQYLNLATDNINRNVGTTTNAFLKTGQGLNTVTNTFDQGNSDFMNMLMRDYEQKARNQEGLYRANKDVADENLRAFDYNKNIPYQQKYNRAVQQTNSGAENIFGGGNDLASMSQLFDFGSMFGGGNKDGASNDTGMGVNTGWIQSLLDKIGQ